MDYSVTFARHFSRLVWLLLHESQNVVEQKAALRALVTVSRDGPVTIASRDWRLVVNGTALPDALTGVQELSAQLIGHAVGEITVRKGAVPADLLGVARILATEPVPGDPGRALFEKMRALAPASVQVTFQQPLRPEPAAAAPPAPPEPPPAPATPSGRGPAVTIGEGPRRRSSGGTIAPELSATPVRSGVVTDESSGRFLAFAAVKKPDGSHPEIFQRLDGSKSIALTTRTLDELVTLAETAAREGKTDTVSEIFHGIVRREAELPDGEMKRAFVMAVRRMSKPTLLRAVAMMLPRRRERHEQYMAVLARTGEDGADALIEQLTAAQSLSDRRVYFDALVALNSGVPALIHMLGDARWYVARNAADLLGEMQAAEAEVPLSELLKHDDDRVRRAAAAALAKIGTTKAMAALNTALRDSSAQVRMQAAAGLASRKGARAATTLTRALDEEPDAEVQLALLAALGRMATPDAVQKLIKAAEPAGGLFKKKAASYRIAAVQALGEARTPAALAALQNLLNDKDKEVRDAVFKIVVQRGS